MVTNSSRSSNLGGKSTSLTSLQLVADNDVDQQASPIDTRYNQRFEIVERSWPVSNCGVQNEIVSLTVNEGGTFLKVKNTKSPSTFINKKISDVPIYPVAILSCFDNNTSDPEIFVELEVVTEKKRKISVPLSSLASLSNNKDAQGVIGRTGISCNRELGYGLHAVTMALRKIGELERRTGTGQTGWADLDNHVRPGSAAYVGGFPQTTDTSGTFEAWRDAIADLAKDSPIFSAVLSFAVGGYCRGVPGIKTDHSGILHLYSTASSKGKTFTQSCCASLQTYPSFKGNVMANAGSTLASTEILLAANNHGAMCLDEIHSLLAKDNNPVERLMMYANGGGRGRVIVRNGGHALADALTWNTTIITSGNSGLEEVYYGHQQADAVRARTIEIDNSTTPIFGFTDFARINKAKTIIMENYGHAYPLIIKYISEHKEKVVGLVHEFEDLACEIAGDTMGGALGRRVESCSLAYAGAYILSEILGISISTAPIVDIFKIEAMVHEKNIENAVQSLRDEVLSLIRTYMGALTVNGYLAVDENEVAVNNDETYDVGPNVPTRQKDRASAHNSRVLVRTTCYGTIVQKKPMAEALDFSECQLFITSSGKNNLRNFDVNAMAHLAKSQGWLLQNGAKNSNTSNASSGEVTMIKSGLGRCYGFDLAVAKRMLDEDDRLNNLGAGDDPWPDIPDPF